MTESRLIQEFSTDHHEWYLANHDRLAKKYTSANPEDWKKEYIFSLAAWNAAKDESVALHETIAALRSELAMERERNQWIDVKQGLPPMTERIERDGLSYSKDVIAWNGEKISMAYLCAFDNQPERWVDTDGDSNDGVMCWMLPEPPALLEAKAEPQPAPVVTGEDTNSASLLL